MAEWAPPEVDQKESWQPPEVQATTVPQPVFLPKSGTQIDVEEMRQYAADPLSIPTIPKQEGTAAQIAAGLANIPIGAVNFMASPAGPPTLALGAAPAAVGKLTAAIFGSEQAAQGILTPSLQEKITSFGGAGLGLLGTLFGVKPETSEASPAAVAEPFIPKETIQPKPVEIAPVVTAPADSLKNIGDLGKGAVISMYDMMFKKLQAGDLTEGGGPSNALRKAYPEFQAGRIKSAEDLQQFFNPPEPTQGEPNAKTPNTQTSSPATVQEQPVIASAESQVQAGDTRNASAEVQTQPVARRNFKDTEDVDLIALYHRYRDDYANRPTPQLDKRIELIGDELAHRSGLPEGVKWGTRGEPSSQAPGSNLAPQAGSVSPKEVTSETPVTPTPEVTATDVSQPAASEVATRGEPQTTGIAQRVNEQRAAEGKIGEIQPGEGISAEESVNRGRELLAQGSNPQEIANRINETKQVSSDDLSVLRAHAEVLAKATNAAEDALRANPNNPAAKAAYDSAWKTETDWLQNAVQPAKTEWSKTGQAMQGETDIDTGSFSGLRRAFVEQKGRDATSVEQAKLQVVADKNKAIDVKVEKAKAAYDSVLAKETTGKLPVTAEELRSHFASRLKSLLPC